MNELNQLIWSRKPLQSPPGTKLLAYTIHYEYTSQEPLVPGPLGRPLFLGRRLWDTEHGTFVRPILWVIPNA